MKNVFLILTLMTLAFVGCKKKDKEPDGPNQIVAKWNLQKSEYVFYKNAAEESRGTLTYAAGSYIEFKKDGTYKLHLKEVSEDDFDEETGSYALTGSELTIKPIDDDPQVLNIKTIDKKNLILEGIDEYKEGDDSYKDMVTIYLNK